MTKDEILAITDRGLTVQMSVDEFLTLWGVHRWVHDQIEEWCKEHQQYIWTSSPDTISIRHVERIIPGTVYRYKDKFYRVNSVMHNNLIQFEDEWCATVRYTEEPQTHLVFYRALPEFLLKFERVL